MIGAIKGEPKVASRRVSRECGGNACQAVTPSFGSLAAVRRSVCRSVRRDRDSRDERAGHETRARLSSSSPSSFPCADQWTPSALISPRSDREECSVLGRKGKRLLAENAETQTRALVEQ